MNSIQAQQIISASDPFSAGTVHFLPTGLTIHELVQMAAPEASGVHGLRVVLAVGPNRMEIPANLWHRVRPKPGARVLVEIVPQGDSLRSVLLAVIQVAATFLAPQVAGFFGIVGKFGVGLVGVGLSIVGSLLVGALIPVDTADPEQSAGKSNSLSGWNNRARPDEPVPLLFGQRRIAPPFAATSYSEIVGDQQFIRALFCLGYGRLSVSDLRIGDTSIDDYDEVEYELRQGLPDDTPVTLYPNQVLEEAENIELVRPLPRDDAGAIINGASVETPVVRQTASDTQIASVILGFGSGLFRVNGNGSIGEAEVSIRIRQRPKGDTVWQEVETLTIRAASRTPMFRQYSWQFPQRGVWDVELTRMTPEATSTEISDRVALSALQSVRPEYPVNIDAPVALLAVRIRATYQLNGTLASLNALAHRYGPVWDGQTWSTGLSRNPATAFLLALQGPSNPFPVADGQIDWDGIAEWYEWCDDKNLKFDRELQAGTSLGEALRSIAGAGRALPRHDGARWSVVIDRPDTLVIDHINARNSAGLSWSRTYFEAPDAFRISFEDETNDYEPAERIVPWPGFAGPIEVTEELQLPGKTDPDEIWVEARRRQYELEHRADSFTTVVPGVVRSLTRGDLVMASYDILQSTHIAARVLRVIDRIIELDEFVDIPDGSDYGIRFAPQDAPGTSVVRPVRAGTERTAAVRLLSGAEIPAPGTVVHLGPLGAESIEMKVRSIEGGENMSTVLNLVAAAPQIDALTDAEPPPAWSARVGSPVSNGGQVPPAPRFISVTSVGGYTPGTEPGEGPQPGPGTLTARLAPSTTAAFIVKAFRLEYRATGEAEWLSQSFPVANGGVTVNGVMTGDAYELRAYAVAVDDTESAASATVSLVIGAGGASIPAALNDGSIMVSGGLGSVDVVVATGSDSATTALQLYRTASGSSLDTSTDAVGAPLEVSPLTTYSIIDGDATRSNILLNGAFDDETVWVAGSGWSFSGGSAVHTPGSAGTISQPAALQAGTTYRVGILVSALPSGTLRAELSGGASQQGQLISGPGWAYDTLTAGAGNDTFVLTASATNDGAVDKAVLYPEAPSSLAAGSYNYYLQPINGDGLAGPISGPFPASVV